MLAPFPRNAVERKDDWAAGNEETVGWVYQYTERRFGVDHPFHFAEWR